MSGVDQRDRLRDPGRRGPGQALDHPFRWGADLEDGASSIGRSNQVTVPLGGAVDREKCGYFHDDVPAEIVNLRALGELMN